jgi:hypothetical protein
MQVALPMCRNKTTSEQILELVLHSACRVPYCVCVCVTVIVLHSACRVPYCVCVCVCETVILLHSACRVP